MKVKKNKTSVFGVECEIHLMFFNKADAKRWKKLFDKWRQLKLALRAWEAREPTLPEGLSEVAFCLWSGSGRLISLRSKIPISTSFDTFNIETGRAEQIKATSIKEDLTSFGPRSKWDDLYFLDFYNNGKLDGSFNVYKMPDGMLDKIQLTKTETFIEQQGQKRRPRLSLLQRFAEIKLEPIAKDVRVWEI